MTKPDKLCSLEGEVEASMTTRTNRTAKLDLRLTPEAKRTLQAAAAAELPQG